MGLCGFEAWFRHCMKILAFCTITYLKYAIGCKWMQWVLTKYHLIKNKKSWSIIIHVWHCQGSKLGVAVYLFLIVVHFECIVYCFLSKMPFLCIKTIFGMFSFSTLFLTHFKTLGFCLVRICHHMLLWLS